MSTSVTYVGPSEAVVLGDGTRFEQGKPVEVDDPDVAASLLEQDVFQGRKPRKTSAAKKAPEKTEPDAPSGDDTPTGDDNPPEEG
jgi:hypothetical protein